MAADDNTTGWTIDKRIPIALLGAILLQALVLTVWGTHLEDRVYSLEHTSATTEQYARVDEKMQTMKDDLGTVKKDMQDIKEDIRRLAMRGGQK